MLELLDSSPQSTGFFLNRIEVLRQLHQTLVGDDALDASHARIQVVEFDLYRIILSRGGSAAAEYRSDCNRNRCWQQQFGHERLPLWLYGRRLTARSQVHDLNTPVLGPGGIVVAGDSRSLSSIADGRQLRLAGSL